MVKKSLHDLSARDFLCSDSFAEAHRVHSYEFGRLGVWHICANDSTQNWGCRDSAGNEARLLKKARLGQRLNYYQRVRRPAAG
jgi:hypothetical protein